MKKKKFKKFLMRNKKKLLISLAVLVVFLFVFFLVPFKNGRTIFGNIIYNRNIKYAYNKEAYDKLKITGVHLTKTTTGTAPFNTPSHESVDDGSVVSNMNGVDVSETDNYVRTFDTFKYDVELSIGKNTNNPEVTDNDDYYGGVIKVKITIPKDSEGRQYYYLVPQAWIKNSGYSTSDTFTAYYQMPRDKVSNGAIQEMNFEFVANGYSKELDESLMPKIEFWMEGNKNDNITSSVESKQLVYENNYLNITGKDSYIIQLTQGEVNYKAKLDGVVGNYVNFGLQYTMVQPYDYINGYRGVNLPYGDISSKLGFDYYYKNSSSTNWEKVSDATDKGRATLDGVKLIAAGLPEDRTPNFKPSEYYNKLASWDDGIYCGGRSSYSVCYDGGQVESTMNNRKISTTNKNWFFRGEIEGNKGTFIYDGLEIFVPYYDQDNIDEYSYKFTVKGINLTYNDKNGDTKTEDSDATYTFNLKKSQDTSAREYFYADYNSVDVTSITLGNYKDFRSSISMYGGAYLGGVSELFTWNSNYLQLPNINKVYRYSSINGANSDRITVKYGVYKNNPQKGITDDNVVDTAVYDDFTWYEDKDTALANGEVSAIYYHDPENYGFDNQHDFHFSLMAKIDMNNLHAVTMVKRKMKACFDEERTDCTTRGYDKVFSKATYENEVFTSASDPRELGDTVFIGRYNTSISVTSYDTMSENYRDMATFNVQEDYLGVSITPKIANVIDELKTEKSNFLIKCYLPNDIYYVDGSANYDPSNIYTNDYGDTVIEFAFNDWTLGDKLPTIRFKGEISQQITNNETRNIAAELLSDDDIKNNQTIGFNGHSLPYKGAINSRTISLVSLAGQSSRKKVSADFVNVNNSFEVENYIYNVSQKTLENIKSIEILPKNNDSNGSKYSGSYTIKVDSIYNNQKIYYTTKSISSLNLGEDRTGLTKINEIDSNWQEVSVGGTIPSNATAIATTINTLSPNEVVSFKYTIIPTGNKAKDKYVFKMNTSSDTLINSITTGNKEISVVNKGIKGRVFIDKNRDDKYDPDDELLKNRTISLLDADKNVIKTTTTDENGEYLFQGLNKGNYYVSFGNIPNGYTVISGEDSVATQDNISPLITGLTEDNNIAEQMVENISAGYKKKEAHLTVKHLITGTNTSLGEEVNSTVYYTDEYTTSPLDPIPTNYKVDYITGITSGEVNKDNIEVIYYYTLKPSNIKVRYVDQDNNDIDLTKNIDENSLWGENYSYEPIDFPYYDYVQSDGDDPSGTISADEITIIFKYKIKKSKLTIKYVDESGKDIDPSKNIIDEVINYGENYSSNQFTFRNYNFLRVDGDPKEGVVEKDRINVTYVYKLKECNFKVLYVDEDGNNIDSTKNIIAVKHWGETYSSEQLEFTNYDFIKVEGEPSGTISSDELTITYKYKLKESTVTIRYIDEDGNDILSPIVTPSNYGKEYTSSIKDIPNYDYVRVEGDPVSGTISKDNILVRYIYKLKVGKVITHHYLYDGGETSTELAPDVEKEYKYMKEYNTTQSDKVTKNYEFYSKTNNYTGIMNANVIEVYYYYQLKDSTLSTNIEKTATEEITNKKDEVSYTINYSANVKEYIGDGVITIVEELPYAIDEEKSNLDGGTYNSENNTITWTIQWRDINTYNESDGESSKSIKKDITLVYEGIVGRDRIMTSNTNANIELSNNNREVEAQASTDIKIPGKVIVSYIDEETGKEIESELEESDLVGESVITTPIEKEGWELIEVPTTTELEYEEDVQTISYIYRRIKFEIITKALNQGGTIEGGEIVPYGDDSTKDKIVITSKEGYVIDKLFIDGEEAKTSNVERLVLGNFKEVKENHLVEVSFKPQPKVVNPFTSHPLISIAVILLIVGTVMTIYHRRRYILAKKR